MSNPVESPFEKRLVKLVKDDVVFATIGGIAMCLNGFIRLTDACPAYTELLVRHKIPRLRSE